MSSPVFLRVFFEVVVALVNDLVVVRRLPELLKGKGKLRTWRKEHFTTATTLRLRTSIFPSHPTSVTHYKNSTFAISGIVHTHYSITPLLLRRMSAAGATTTGADFLKSGRLDGNLRRVNSSEDTAVASDNESVGDLNGDGDTDPQVEILGPQGTYDVATLSVEAKEDFINRSPPPISLPPCLAQVVDSGTFLAMMAYFGTIAFFIPSAVAAGQSPIWPTLFIASKALNYCKEAPRGSVVIPLTLHSAGQIIDHAWRFRSTIATKRDITPRRRIQGEEVPKVDIIITTYNEQVENVIDTVAAAVAVDYPTEKFRVFVSDDGKDAELEKQVSELKLKNSNIVYFARDKNHRPNGSEHHGSKAGNVNDCIHYAKQLEKDPAEYFVCLDADMIPARDILRALVAHVVEDVKVGMVTLPQVSIFDSILTAPKNNINS